MALKSNKNRRVKEITDGYKRDKAEYQTLFEYQKESWLKYKGYKAEDFADDVLDDGNKLDNSGEIRYSFKGKKTARYINKKLDTPTLSFIRNELRKIYGPIDSAIADGIAIEKDNTIFVVDSGMEDGLIDFGVRQQIKIDDDKLRKERLEKINDRAVSNGFSSSEISGRIKRSPDNGGRSSVQRELQKELSDNTRKSENNESRISEKDATDGSRRLKFSLKDSDGNELSPEQQEYFKNSKVVDKDGNLLVVYHGSKANENVFSEEFISSWSMFGKGFYFTTSERRAKGHAKVSLKECYINLENPFVTNNEEHLASLYKEINNTKKDIEEYSEEKGIGGREFFKICNYLDDIGVDVSKHIKALGFDGIIHTGYEDIEVVAYKSNQIKLTTNKKPTSNSDIRFSLKSFSEQVDDVLNGVDTSNTHLKVMDTPILLQDAGLPNLPILMTAKHVKTITSAEGKGNVNYHGLDVDIVKNLPNYISNPVMIADSFTRNDSIVIITEAIDSKNRPVIAAIVLNGEGRLSQKHIKANILTSAYGRNNFQSFLNRIADENAIIYWNKKKSQDLSVSLGIQFPNAITSLDPNIIIRKAKTFVNTDLKNFTNKPRFSLKEKPTYTLSDGQVKKKVADYTRLKYS